MRPATQTLGQDSSFTGVTVYQVSAEGKNLLHDCLITTGPVAKFTQKSPASRLKTDTMVGIDDSRKGNSVRLLGMGLAAMICIWSH